MQHVMCESFVLRAFLEVVQNASLNFCSFTLNFHAWKAFILIFQYLFQLTENQKEKLFSAEIIVRLRWGICHQWN